MPATKGIKKLSSRWSSQIFILKDSANIENIAAITAYFASMKKLAAINATKIENKKLASVLLLFIGFLYFLPTREKKYEAGSANVNIAIEARAMFCGNSFITNKEPATKNKSDLPGNSSLCLFNSKFSRKKPITGILIMNDKNERIIPKIKP